MGDWFPNPDGSWRHDDRAPTPYRGPDSTQLLPVVKPEPDLRRTFTHDDGSVYTRIPAGAFESFDDVDSTTIVDPGAPD